MKLFSNTKGTHSKQSNGYDEQIGIKQIINKVGKYQGVKEAWTY